MGEGITIGGMHGELVGMKGSGRKGENFSQLVHSSSLITSQTESPITEFARLELLGRRRLEMRWEATREAVRVGRDMVDSLITARMVQFYHMYHLS